MTFVLASLPGNENENLSKIECMEEKADIYIYIYCFYLQKNRMGLKVKVLENRL